MVPAPVVRAERKSWQKSRILLDTPLPAETVTPYLLMRVSTTSQEMEAMVHWRATGKPSFRVRLTISASGRR